MRFAIDNTMEVMTRAWEYTTYIMMASYFNKTNCKSKAVETSLRLHYKDFGYCTESGKKADKEVEQVKEKLYVMEEKCINMIEKNILPRVPEEFLDSEVSVYLFKTETGDTVIKFSNNKYDLVVLPKCSKDGKKIKYMVGSVNNTSGLFTSEEKEVILKYSNKFSYREMKKAERVQKLVDATVSAVVKEIDSSADKASTDATENSKEIVDMLYVGIDDATLDRMYTAFEKLVDDKDADILYMLSGNAA